MHAYLTIKNPDNYISRKAPVTYIPNLYHLPRSLPLQIGKLRSSPKSKQQGQEPNFSSHEADLGILARKLLRAFTDLMVKPLTFKGDKKAKKRKRTETESATEGVGPSELAVARPPEDEGDDDSWVSAEAVGDVVGPVMLVLPTEPPTCLACDANGKVFTDPIENIIDANPASAEPHNVRQVWVANKIYGTENFRFKGRYGKYVVSIDVFV